MYLFTLITKKEKAVTFMICIITCSFVSTEICSERKRGNLMNRITSVYIHSRMRNRSVESFKSNKIVWSGVPQHCSPRVRWAVLPNDIIFILHEYHSDVLLSLLFLYHSRFKLFRPSAKHKKGKFSFLVFITGLIISTRRHQLSSNTRVCFYCTTFYDNI